MDVIYYTIKKVFFCGPKPLFLIRMCYKPFLIANKMYFLYEFQSTLPIHHSFVRINVTARRNTTLRVDSIILELLFIVITIRMEISISKIRNIMITIMKFVEKFIFLALILMYPHSNLVFLSFDSFFSSVIFQNIIISIVAIIILVKVAIIMVIDFVSFNWKLSVNFILYSLIFLINKLIGIKITKQCLQSVSIRLLFQMSCGDFF